MTQKQTSLDMDCSMDDCSENYSEYIDNLKANNQMITMALKTAETLIDEYQRQNKQLKNKNNALEEQLHDREEQLQYLKGLMMNQEHQVALEMKVKDLMDRNEEYEYKIMQLTQQLQRCNKRILQIGKQKQVGLEKTLGNYFKFSKSLHQNHPQNLTSQNLSKQIRSLNWKLQQRQDEINMLLRRNKLLQQKLYKIKAQHKQQLPTCPTQQSKNRFNRDY